jgi:hypothetical protein
MPERNISIKIFNLHFALEGCPIMWPPFVENLVFSSAEIVADQIEKVRKIGGILVSKMKQQRITRLINISLAVIQLPHEKLDFQRKAIRVLVILFF